MRRFAFLSWALFVTFTLCVVSPTVAAAAAAAADTSHGDGGSANPLAIKYDTAIWSVLIFLGLLLILRSKAWGPILDGLQKREETIRSSIEEARRTRDEMERMRADFHRELSEAHQQIPRLMED